MPINCGAIQTTLLELNYLVTKQGPLRRRKNEIGLMEVVDGGILFLDEISTCRLICSQNVARTEERAFRRLAQNMIHDAGIAASNRNLEKMVEENIFREDLYYRLKVVHLHIPPLRERNRTSSIGGIVYQPNCSRMVKTSLILPRNGCSEIV
jgi:transcriptional regulator with PAS, ATPase and Fis domain